MLLLQDNNKRRFKKNTVKLRYNASTNNDFLVITFYFLGPDPTGSFLLNVY